MQKFNNIPSISIELQRTAAAYLNCLATEERVRPVVIAYQTKVLAERQYRDDETGEIITDPKNAWSMNEIFFVEYSALLDIEANKAGFDVPVDHCPLLIAENETRKARRALIDALRYITKIGSDDVLNLDDRAKMAELALGLVASAKKEKLDKLAVEKATGREFSASRRFSGDGKIWVVGRWVGEHGKPLTLDQEMFDFPNGKPR